MPHTTNISGFRAAAGSADPLISAYCGLVAIELALKQHVALGNHDVCSGLNKFRMLKAVDSRSWTGHILIGLTDRLRRDIQAISVNDKFGSAVAAPGHSFPFIRYTRCETDGWPAPFATFDQISTLADTVKQVRSLLKTPFGLPL